MVRTLLFVFIWLGSGLLYGLKSQSDRQIVRTLDSLLEELNFRKIYSGQVVLAESGQIIYSRAFGNLSDRNNEKISISTPIDVASVSKTFTAGAILLLMESGHLNLEDDISDFIPSWPFKGVTIWHLLNHTSGLPDISGAIFEQMDHGQYYSNRDIIKLLTGSHLEPDAPAGAKFRYGNLGYDLLGTIIEKSSGKTYETYIREKILQPLGMSHTFHYSEFRKLRNLNPAVDIDNFHRLTQGASNYYSTAEDLLKWDQGLQSGKILNKNTLQLITERPRLENGEYGPWGLGWNLIHPEPDNLTLQHMGEGFASTTSLTRYLAENKTYVFIHTGPRNLAYEVFSMIKNIWEGAPYSVPEKKTVYAIDPALLSEYSGDYGENGYMHLFLDEGRFYMKADGAPSPIELIPSSDSTFYFQEEHMRWQIYRSGNNVTGFGPLGQKQHMMVKFQE